jgi:hypothetical protein
VVRPTADCRPQSAVAVPVEVLVGTKVRVSGSGGPVSCFVFRAVTWLLYAVWVAVL